MNKLDLIVERYSDAEWLSADGFEDAILGVSNERLVYSMTKCIEILMKRDGMTEEEAMEYFSFNVEGAYMGEKTPIWVDDVVLEDYIE